MADLTNDELREAVELAEGWRVEADHHGEYYVVAGIWNCPADEGLPQHDLDALAAQLVRQVKAIPNAGISIVFGYAGIVMPDGQLAQAEGDDDTDNTIRVCVEVLRG